METHTLCCWFVYVCVRVCVCVCILQEKQDTLVDMDKAARALKGIQDEPTDEEKKSKENAIKKILAKGTSYSLVNQCVICVLINSHRTYQTLKTLLDLCFLLPRPTLHAH